MLSETSIRAPISAVLSSPMVALIADSEITLILSAEQAKAITEAAPDDAGAMNNALISMVQQRAFKVLVDMQEGAPIKDIGLMVARLSNATVKQKQWAAEVREKAATAADAVEKIAKKGGLSPAAVSEIKRRILGIPS